MNKDMRYRYFASEINQGLINLAPWAPQSPVSENCRRRLSCMSILPSASKSWFPGHMATFLRHQLPTLLSSQVDVVLEVRDVRMPLTSIHPDLEGILSQWRERRKQGKVCERIVVYTKRDLVDVLGQEVGGYLQLVSVLEAEET